MAAKTPVSEPATPPLSRPKGRIDYRWIVLSVTTIGSLMAAIDGTIVILGLPAMMTELHANLVSIIWVIIAYLLMSTVLLLVLGRIADLVGRVRLYNLGFLIFTIGSLFCGLSGSAAELIASRVLQGGGAALMLVNSVAIITEAFPPEQRGRALSANSVTFAAGGVIGPILGGFILTIASWRWIFFVNLPIGIAGTVWGYFALKELATKRTRQPLDWAGAIAFSLGLAALLGAMTAGIQYNYNSPQVLVLVIIALSAFLFFWWHERTVPSPLIDLGLLANRAYGFAVLSAMVQGLAIFAVNFLVIFYLIGVRGHNPLTAAVLLIPLPIMLALAAPVGGWLADRRGARLPATLGLLIQAAALLLLTRLSATTSYAGIALPLALMGLGGGLFFAPNTSAAMNAAPRQSLGVASATLSTMRQTGMVTSFALALLVAASSIPRDIVQQLFVGTNVVLGSDITSAFIGGMHNAFLVSMLLCLVAALLSFLRGQRPTSGARVEHSGSKK